MAAGAGAGLLVLGSGEGGKLGHGATTNLPTPAAVALAAVPVRVACGCSHTAVVDEEGGVWTFGSGVYGALGHGTLQDCVVPTLVQALQGVCCSSVACGAYHTLSLSAQGEVHSWGWGDDGQLGRRDESQSLTPVRVTGLGTCVVVACGHHHSAAILQSGEVLTWGSNTHGQLGHGSTLSANEPTAAVGLAAQPAKAIACGANHTAVLLVDGALYVAGSNCDGQLGIVGSDMATKFSRVELGLGGLVRAVRCGEDHTAVVMERGEFLTFGAGGFGRLGHGNQAPAHEPTVVKQLRGKTVVDFACGTYHTVVLTDTGEVWGFGQLHPDGDPLLTPRTIAGLSFCSVVRLSCGDLYTVAVTAAGDEPLVLEEPEVARGLASERSRVKQGAADIDPDTASIILQQEKELQEAKHGQLALQAEANQLRLQVEQLERNSHELWVQSKGEQQHLEELVKEHKAAIECVHNDLQSIATRLAQQAKDHGADAAEQRKQLQGIWQEHKQANGQLLQQQAAILTTLGSLVDQLNESRGDVEQQKELHAQDKQVLSSVISDLRHALGVAEKEKEAIWAQANASKDALSKQLEDVNDARAKAAAARAAEDEAKVLVRDLKMAHEKEVERLQQQQEQSNEDHQELVDALKAKNQRLTAANKTLQDQIVQAQVDHEIVQTKLQQTEAESGQEVQRLRREMGAVADNCGKLSARVGVLEAERQELTASLHSTREELAACSKSLRATLKDKAVLTGVMKDVEARHKRALETAQEEVKAKQQEVDSVRQELAAAHARIKGRDEKLAQLKEKLGALLRVTAALRTDLHQQKRAQLDTANEADRLVAEAKVAVARTHQQLRELAAKMGELEQHYQQGRADARAAAETFAAEREVLVRVLRDHQTDRTSWEREKGKLQESLTTALTQLTMMHSERAQEKDLEKEQNQILRRALESAEASLEEQRGECKDLRAKLQRVQDHADRAQHEREELWQQSKLDKEMTTKLVAQLERQLETAGKA